MRRCRLTISMVRIVYPDKQPVLGSLSEPVALAARTLAALDARSTRRGGRGRQRRTRRQHGDRETDDPRQRRTQPRAPPAGFAFTFHQRLSEGRLRGQGHRCAMDAYLRVVIAAGCAVGRSTLTAGRSAERRLRGPVVINLCLGYPLPEATMMRSTLLVIRRARAVGSPRP